MRNDWIIDVLTDLSSFARRNGYLALAEQLEDTKLVAAGELAAAPGVEHAPAPGRTHRAAVAHEQP